jgi:hypothetical protein
MQKFTKLALAGLVILASSCSKNDKTSGPTGQATYILGLGITVSSGSTATTTNYVVKANSLDSGTISPLGNGLTLLGYRDYAIGNSTVFAIGGLDVTNINGIDQDANGNLVVSGSTNLDVAGDDIQQADASQMLELKIPGSAAAGNNIVFNMIDISTKAINKTYTVDATPLMRGGDYPTYTGMSIKGNQLFVSFMHFTASYTTLHTDTNYIAVFSYPNIAYQKTIVDARTGPTGAWATKDGLLQDEKGDIYAMSSTNIGNGYSQSTKPGGFLRIKSGATDFDADYFWNTDAVTGKISHIKYLGNGLAFATISTVARPTQWADVSLKMAIIDIYNQKVTDVKLDGGTAANLIHDGNGGRSFPVLYANNKVYYTATIGGATNIYVIDPATATAKKGAQINATFTGGIFKVK